MDTAIPLIWSVYDKDSEQLTVAPLLPFVVNLSLANGVVMRSFLTVAQCGTTMSQR